MDGERVPEKSRGLLRPDASLAERCAVIEAEKANYKITWMCRLLDVPRSSFYAWRNRVETRPRHVAGGWRVEVRRVFEASRQTSGCRRVAAR